MNILITGANGFIGSHLVEALLERRMPVLMEQRRRMLATLAEQDPAAIDDIINALVQPLADFVLNGGDSGIRYVQFIARLYTGRSEIFQRVSARIRRSIS